MAVTALSNIAASNKVAPLSSLNLGGASGLSGNSSTNSGTQNNGGVLGGIGYVGEKVGLGFLSGIEGIWDYTAGGLAKLFGADDWAEQQFSNDWVNYNDADEWYSPSDGWKIAGDIAGGIGTSLPAIVGAAAGAAIIYFSGGTLTSVGSKLILGSISSAIAGFGAAGASTKEAYRESGELTGKEFGYGALSGVTEAGMEIAETFLTAGTGRIVSSIASKAAKETAKETAQTVAKVGVKTVLKDVVKDFATEAVEEGLQEYLEPKYAKITYDPNAKDATAGEIGYAAIIGGISGAIMSGGFTAITAGVNSAANLVSGNKAITNGTVQSVLNTSRQLAETESANNTDIPAFQFIRETYEELSKSLETTGGVVSTVKQKMQLGALKAANVSAIFTPFVERSALNILQNADAVAQRYNEFGMTDESGKKITFTAKDFTAGIDLTADSKTRAHQIRQALTTNSKLARSINSLGVSVDQRLLLIAAKGYSLQDGDVGKLSAEAAKKRLLRYILGQGNMTAAEKANLAQMCGFEVKNGRIVTSSLKSNK